MTDSIRTSDLIATIKDGDEHGWDTEFAWLEKHHAPQQRRLEESIAIHGILKPVLIGSDGRLWDGHHRVYAAVKLGLESIPVEYA